MFKFNNKDTNDFVLMYLLLTLKYFTASSNVLIADFEHVFICLHCKKDYMFLFHLITT